MYPSEEQYLQHKTANLNNLILALSHLAFELNKTPGPRELGLLEMSRAWGAVMDDEPKVLYDVAIPLSLLTPAYFTRLVDVVIQLQPDFVPAIRSQVFSMGSKRSHEELMQSLTDFSLRVKDGLFVLSEHNEVSSIISLHDRSYLEVWALSLSGSDQIREANTWAFGSHEPEACIVADRLKRLVFIGGFDALMDAMAQGIITRSAFMMSMNYIHAGRGAVVDQRDVINDMVRGWPTILHDQNAFSRDREVDRAPKVRFLLMQHFGESFYVENAKTLHEMVIDALNSYSSRARFTPMEREACPEEMEDAAQQVSKDLGHVTRDHFGIHHVQFGYDGLFLQMRAQPGLIERMQSQHKTGWFATEIFMLLTVQEFIHHMVCDRLPLGMADLDLQPTGEPIMGDDSPSSVIN